MPGWVVLLVKFFLDVSGNIWKKLVFGIQKYSYLMTLKNLYYLFQCCTFPALEWHNLQHPAAFPRKSKKIEFEKYARNIEHVNAVKL